MFIWTHAMFTNTIVYDIQVAKIIQYLYYVNDLMYNVFRDIHFSKSVDLVVAESNYRKKSFTSFLLYRNQSKLLIRMFSFSDLYRYCFVSIIFHFVVVVFLNQVRSLA